MQDERWTREDLLRLAASGVAKVDLLGPRGTTLCSMDEIAAMAGLLAVSGLLPPPGAPDGVNETPKFTTRRKA
ncbi:hypothetical protein QO034_06390 [Sedimentitalea sp. JM2-8]|uniref:Uncharacterized protein n=1 Tax=Sedimentitalea xiamensis TaxID=3050037 RepID=A0ABT7FC93_9RHOB|nr:hypothetical protein [Sedimentitalea xiamensis]MDK3072732.1 hypothetical protein [Sedimentitalea xiamensis]